VIGVGTETVSATANFFDLGGTSLETLQLTRTLNQRFDLDASLTTVLQSPTIRGLAALIEQGNDRASVPYDPLVPLQESGRRTPLFCIHPGDGGTFVFVNLAKYFVNERPVYALRPRGFNPREQCFHTFGEIVDTYVTAIQRVQPHGPYAIAGYSLGGSIAFEVARTLEARGHEVPFLGCIDGVPCGVEMPASFAAALVGAAQVLNLIDKRHFASWTRVATSLQDLSRSYSIQGAIAEMTVFTSAGLPPNIKAEDWRSLIYRWSEFVHRPRYVEVAGDHISLLSPKHVASFQGLLHAELACKLGED
jgi:thioesterase domain-containing protein/acyl carrier protein